MISFFSGISALLSKLIAICTAMLLSLGVFTPPKTTNPLPAGAEKPLLQTALLADSQIWANSDRHWTFMAACEDIQNNAAAIDAVVLAGDLTESGDDPTDQVVIDLLAGLSVDKKIIASGNHDVRLNYSHTMDRFIQDVNTLGAADYTVEKPYYRVEVNGYVFVVLGSEKQRMEKAYISDEQLAFLDESLALGTEDGKPVFVICHQPLSNTHGLPGIWRTGDLGEQSEKIISILKKYDNVFFLSGHTHSGFGGYTYDDSIPGVHLVNIPPVGKKASRSYEAAGQGIVMQVYEDRVEFKSRNFADGLWLGDAHPDFDRTYELV